MLRAASGPRSGENIRLLRRVTNFHGGSAVQCSASLYRQFGALDYGRSHSKEARSWNILRAFLIRPPQRVRRPKRRWHSRKPTGCSSSVSGFSRHCPSRALISSACNRSSRKLDAWKARQRRQKSQTDAVARATRSLRVARYGISACCGRRLRNHGGDWWRMSARRPR
jgi:hypothetical protein